MVGTAETPNGSPRAFAYDLSETAPAMRNLGTFGGNLSQASAVDDGVVVGTATLLGGDDFDMPFTRAFAYD